MLGQNSCLEGLEANPVPSVIITNQPAGLNLQAGFMLRPIIIIVVNHLVSVRQQNGRPLKKLTKRIVLSRSKQLKISS
jgi:hypothetical protein